MDKKPLQPTDKFSDTLHPVHPEITNYLNDLYPVRDEVLEKMEDLAAQRSFPIIGRHVGHFLKVLTLCHGARRIFEFGSGFGYSAYWFAQGIPDDGEIVCTDGDTENEIQAKNFLSQAGCWDLVNYQVGWAQDLFKQTPGSFDIIYNDVDKGDYPEIWELAKERLESGGLYIADNSLWHGRVVQETVENDVKPGWTEAVKKHNEAIVNDPEFDSFLNPVRDGVIVARKK